ncbi:hypothetical protein KIH74_22825 [Kineosporia sp. J2-2]|uniref:Uncharacterized protein n=1 Tax=Kineosporia corallincola TaxID=2835133 RepID=A0ABS5TP12_9ACTN|nr:hypothetical protein [Kineosporia corallincola]MBT0771793.1 hypothetical protein [Kineosporia corallincola]
MGYEILAPHAGRRYLSTVRDYQRRVTARVAEDAIDRAADAAMMDAAVAAEVVFVETGVQRPLFVGGRWLVSDGVSWREVPAPGDAPLEIRVGRWVA